MNKSVRSVKFPGWTIAEMQSIADSNRLPKNKVTVSSFVLLAVFEKIIENHEKPVKLTKRAVKKAERNAWVLCAPRHTKSYLKE